MSDSIDVSVIVCTYNRAGMLRRALESLTRLETDGLWRYEVVVINNALTDTTEQVIAEVAAKAPIPMRGFYELRKGVAVARNRGIAEARGPWIAFFDDDQLADPAWLKELLAIARQKNARCAGGAVRLVLDEEGCPEPAPVYQHVLSPSLRRKSACLYGSTFAPGAGNLLIHRTLFDEVGTFDETLTTSGEDTDLFRRICAAGEQAWFTPKAIIYHFTPSYRMSDKYLRFRFLSYGRTLALRDVQALKRPLFWFSVLARVGRSLVLHLPVALAARLLGRKEQTVRAWSQLWRTEGYARTALQHAAPRLFAQRHFFAQLDFRSEREMFEK